MKRYFLFFAAMLLVKLVAALPNYICTSGGYAFYVSWSPNMNGGYDYELFPFGHCVGGPWVRGILVMSPQEAAINDVPEGSPAIYDSFESFIPSAESDLEKPRAEVETTLTPPPGTTITCYINPHYIDGIYARMFAQRNGKSLYALTVREDPALYTINFEVWSTGQQDVQAHIRTINSGQSLYSNTISVVEGVNSKSMTVPSTLKGTYLFTIESSQNVISRNIVMQ